MPVLPGAEAPARAQILLRVIKKAQNGKHRPLSYPTLVALARAELASRPVTFTSFGYYLRTIARESLCARELAEPVFKRFDSGIADVRDQVSPSKKPKCASKWGLPPLCWYGEWHW